MFLQLKILFSSVVFQCVRDLVGSKLSQDVAGHVGCVARRDFARSPALFKLQFKWRLISSKWDYFLSNILSLFYTIIYSSLFDDTLIVFIVILSDQVVVVTSLS